MNRRSRTVATLVATLMVVTGLSACSTVAEPDRIGLYYMMGPSDGHQFGECVEPGKTGPGEWNNEIIYLPTSLRTWNIAEQGGDSDRPIVASSKPQEGQPSGVEVAVYSQTNLYLNTFCGDDGGVVRQFWESLGRRYSADTEEGWRSLLLATVVPALEKSTRDVIRGYGADALVGNIDGVLAVVQTAIGVQFSEELKRLAGGNFFCGPTFTRASPDCPAVELIIKDVVFADQGIQQARNDKQKALEEAAAQLARAQAAAEALKAEAQGRVDAAKKLEELYKNPAWVRLEMARIQYEIAKACGQNPNCHMIMGADGQIIKNFS